MDKIKFLKRYLLLAVFLSFLPSTAKASHPIFICKECLEISLAETPLCCGEKVKFAKHMDFSFANYIMKHTDAPHSIWRQLSGREFNNVFKKKKLALCFNCMQCFFRNEDINDVGCDCCDCYKRYLYPLSREHSKALDLPNKHNNFLWSSWREESLIIYEPH